MKGLSILSLAVSETETVFDVVDGALDGCADLIGGLPFLCSADRSGVEAEVLLRIEVDHTSAFGIRAWIVAVADTVLFPVPAFLPAHFGTDELECFQAAAQMRGVPSGLMGREGSCGQQGIPSSLIV